MIRSAVLVTCLILSTAAATSYAADRSNGSLPDTLDLHYVLRDVDISMHHLQLMRAAERSAAESVIAGTDAAYTTEADLNLHARWIDRNELSVDPSSEDHKATLNINRRLYDFGVSGKLEDSYRSLLQAVAIDDEIALAMHRIEIAKKFFDVLLSDLAFLWLDEAMAMEFVRLDSSRDRFELRQIDEIELLSAETRYQSALAERNRSSLRQRVSRSRLAEVLALPDELPTVLATPALPDMLTAPLDPLEMIEVAVARSPQLRARQQEVAAAQQRYEAESSRWQPSLDAAIELAGYARDLPSREDWSAELRLQIPLLENGINKAGAAAAWSELKRSTARLQRTESVMREDIYTAWENIGALVSTSTAMQTALRHAERSLDKSRGEYELELRTDFGDALVEVSRLRYERAVVDYRLVIEKMKLALMLGEDPVALVLGDTDG